MRSCDALAPLLAARAAGDLSAEERAELEAHLEVCADCREEAELLGETLALAALPRPSDLEVRALTGLPEQTLSAWRAQERVQRSSLRVFGGGLAAAAALLLAFGVGRAHLRPAATLAAPPVEGSQLAVDELPDGPVELAGDDPDPAAFDPELAPTVYSEEGDD